MSSTIMVYTLGDLYLTEPFTVVSNDLYNLVCEDQRLVGPMPVAKPSG